MNAIKSIRDLDLHGLRKRRPDAIAHWFESYADAIYGFVFYRVGGDPALAADAAQETFVTALMQIERFDPGRGEMFPWLTFIARNCVRKVLRRNHRECDLLELWNGLDRRLVDSLDSGPANALPLEVLEKKETQELVRGALSTLRPRYRQTLEQHYYDGLTLAEIAALTGSTEGAVKTMLHRARRAFRAAFSALASGLEDMGATR